MADKRTEMVAESFHKMKQLSLDLPVAGSRNAADID
jgi:hypothetical protein